MQTESGTFGEIVKSRYWRREDAAVVVDAWRRSGESMAAFARQWSLSDARIARWVARLCDEERELVDFHPVRVVEAVEVCPAGARFTGDVQRSGWTIRVPLGFEADEMARLLRVVDEVTS